jgi:hypothetical protein
MLCYKVVKRSNIPPNSWDRKRKHPRSALFFINSPMSSVAAPPRVQFVVSGKFIALLLIAACLLGAGQVVAPPEDPRLFFPFGNPV